jgi:cellulose synthase/poly-beta-1,6-N-acetylglucosamine synthase-like glycosyltransferase
VTVQLPLYNEQAVATRLIEAAARLDYPPERLELQILDDSNDATSALVDAAAAEARRSGCTVTVLRRTARTGYKAGALAVGTRRARGEILAIFDADFVPPASFLRQTVPFLMADQKLACVQGRWGHLNEHASLLTRVQAMGIDGHFAIEQAVRSACGWFMNFNGTAGIWRKQAIDDAGGWSAETLTEDMELSYRAQLRGWRIRYLLDAVAPGEIPGTLRALQQQQFRWAKGSIETARRMSGPVLRSDASWGEKIQALLHMTHYAIHPLMLLSMLLAPWVLLLTPGLAPLWLFMLLFAGFLFSMSAPNLSYLTATKILAPQHLWIRFCTLPLVMLVGMGLSINNTRAVLEALCGMRSAFRRTPKQGSALHLGESYHLQLNWSVPLELLASGYAFWGCLLYLERAQFWIGPFLGLYGCSYLFAALIGLSEGLKPRRKPQMRQPQTAPVAETTELAV